MISIQRQFVRGGLTFNLDYWKRVFQNKKSDKKATRTAGQNCLKSGHGYVPGHGHVPPPILERYEATVLTGGKGHRQGTAYSPCHQWGRSNPQHSGIYMVIKLKIM